MEEILNYNVGSPVIYVVRARKTPCESIDEIRIIIHGRTCSP
jgi:hypothetical protein